MVHIFSYHGRHYHKIQVKKMEAWQELLPYSGVLCCRKPFMRKKMHALCHLLNEKILNEAI